MLIPKTNTGKSYIIQCTGTRLIDGYYSYEDHSNAEGYRRLAGLAAYWESQTGYPAQIHTVVDEQTKGLSKLNKVYPLR